MSRKTLTETISDMAIKTFYEGVEGDIDDEKRDRWFDHWFKTADRFQKSLEEEGLTETVEAVKKIIIDQKEIVSIITNWKEI